MPTTPNNSNPADPDSTPGVLSAAFLALRERSRVLLRERSAELQKLEYKLQIEVAQLVAELDRPQPVASDSVATQLNELEQRLHDQMSQLVAELARPNAVASDLVATQLNELEQRLHKQMSQLVAELARPNAMASDLVATHLNELEQRLHNQISQLVAELARPKAVTSDAVAKQLNELEQRLHNQMSQLVAELARPKAVASDSVATRERIASLEAEVDSLQQLRRDSEQALDEARIMLVEMEDERRALHERLAAEEAPRSQPAAQNNDDAELERLQRRLEMATQEIRELKHQNAELNSRPQKSAAPQRPAEVELKSFDWETQKQRLLQQLETDFDSGQPEQAQAKLQIEDVIRKTDRIVAEKDRELEELRLLLEQRPVQDEGNSSDTTAREQLLDADAAVLAERARLSQLQSEWREKLRKSEVEISIERAKLARERLQLEEKLRTLQVQNATAEEDAKNKVTDDPKSSGTPRGRWLTRLGLGGSE